MTIKEALKKYNSIEIELLLSYVLGKSKEFLYLNPGGKLSSYQVLKLSSLIGRRLNGEPIAYILGYKDFYGLRFKVNRDVLIPRPETELLVNHVIASVAKQSFKRSPRPFGPRDDKLRILDVGTGSGCIAIVIAKSVTGEGLGVTASDISSAALKVAKQNAKKHKAKIKFVKSDLFNNIPTKFDIIIANLPYVPRMFYKSNHKTLAWEPKAALIDPKKDFDIYKRFFKEVGNHLNKKATIFLEIDPKTKPLVANWTKKYLASSQTKFYRDFNNLWRYVEIKIKK